ncbi:4383_t:CDS:2 [Acaulospora morrowiae]|uniref:4383_t:CDS:1 n=1 Tax=Acaulospora morrowiae TaxID=94023 RepID=A0A9N8VIJ4_9GLOM|nr:4383_t:CDS:2 [Acaulospora morrowiae]
MSSINAIESDLDEQRQAAFLQLRPLCVSLMTSIITSHEKVQDIIQTINSLHSTLEAIPEASKVLDFNLIKYVFFPLSNLYNNPALRESDRFLEGFLNCIQFLLSTSWHNYMMPDQFKQLLILLVSIIGGSFSSGSKDTKGDQTNSKFSISEETKLVGVRCILALLPRQLEYDETNDINNFQLPIRRELLLIELRDTKLRAVVGRCVYVLLEIISNERFLQLRIASIETLQQLTVCIDDPGIVAAFLPGVLSTLSKVIIRDQKENHMLLVKIVESLATIVYTVMNDKVNEGLFYKSDSLNDLKDVLMSSDSFHNNSSLSSFETRSTLQASLSAPPPMTPATIYVERTKSWLRATKMQIKILIGQIFTIRNHYSWQLRLAFVEFTYKLLSHCINSLDNCTPLLIETLVFYLNDDYEQVSIPCKKYLKELRVHPNFSEILTPNLKEGLSSWLTSLPRYLVGLDENAKYNALTLIAGFIFLLGSDVQTVLNNLLHKVSDGLLNALEFDTGDVRIVEDQLLIGQYEDLANDHLVLENFHASDRLLPPFPQVKYKHIRERRVTSTISTVVRLIGYFGKIEFLIEHFLTYLRDPDSKKFHAQCIFIVNEILLGASGINLNFEYLEMVNPTNSANEVKRIARSLLREYMETDSACERVEEFESKSLVKSNKGKRVEPNLINEYTGKSTRMENIESQNRSILIKCFTLEGIAHISRVMTVEFKVELTDALYPILEKMGETNSRIHNTADTALHHVSVCCGYSSKKALVLENIDYLINTVSRKLNHITPNPQTPQVLTAMIRVVGHPVIPYLDDSIEEIFDALDTHHMKFHLLCQLTIVLFAVISAIAEPHEKEHDENHSNENIVIEEDNCVNPPKQVTAGMSKEISEFIESYSLQDTQTNLPKEYATLEEIGQYFLNIHKSKEKAEVDDIPEHEADPETIYPNEETSDKKAKPTRSQSICLKIIDKVLHSLTSASPQLRFLVLDIIRTALPVLQPISNELYPLVHRIWPSVVNRLKDEEQFVVLGAARLIQGIAISCGDFFTSRVVQDVWPSFQDLLLQQATNDKEYSDLMNYEFSRSHRIKKAILETMKVVVHRVLLSNQVISQIIDTMWPFLSDEVHEDLQKIALELFRELAHRDANTTWLVLRGLVEDYTLLVFENKSDYNDNNGESMLEDITWPKYLCRFPEGGKKDQYTRNARILLDEIE